MTTDHPQQAAYRRLFIRIIIFPIMFEMCQGQTN